MIIVFINERPQAALCWIADFEGVLRVHQLISFMTYAELYCRFILEPCSALVSCISLRVRRCQSQSQRSASPKTMSTFIGLISLLTWTDFLDCSNSNATINLFKIIYLF